MNSKVCAFVLPKSNCIGNVTLLSSFFFSFSNSRRPIVSKETVPFLHSFNDFPKSWMDQHHIATLDKQKKKMLLPKFQML